MGIDTTLLWEGTGIEKSDLLSQVHISNSSFRTLLSNAIRLSGDPAFGFRFGRHSQPFSGGDAGIATISAPNLISSITAFISFNRLRATYLPVELTPFFWDEQHIHRFVVHEHFDLKDTRRTQLEVLLMSLLNVVEFAIGRPFTEGRFYFSFEAPEYANEYPDVFHCPCEFGASFTGLDLPAHLSRQLLPTYNQSIWEVANSRCNQMMSEMASPETPLHSQRVMELLYSQPPPLPAVKEVASNMSLSERSLHRRLQAENQSYRKLHNHVQKNWASHYLVHSAMPIDNIAMQLGYMDNSNFRRAFRTWFECTPSEYRRRNS